MTKLLLSILLFAGSWNLTDVTVVYIVTTYYAEVYHKDLKCGALKGPLERGTVKGVSLEEAKKMDRRACRRCYRIKQQKNY